MTIAYSKINLKDEAERVPVYMKLERDVLEWFKKQGKGYQNRINKVLKGYKEYAESQVEQAQQLYFKYHTQCFWHMKKDLEITEELVPIVIERLKKYGGKEGYLAADRLTK